MLPVLTSDTNSPSVLIQPEVQSVERSASVSLDGLDASVLSSLIENMDSQNEIVCVVATLAGVKHGFSYVDWVEPSLENPETHWLPTHLEQLGVEYRVELFEDTPLDENQLVVLGSRQKSAFEELPPISEYEDFNDYSDSNIEVMGRFLGVPEQDCVWFEEENSPDIEEAMPLTGAINWQPEVRYARLVSWVCRPTEEGLSRTIDKGRQFYKACLEATRHTGLDAPVEAAVTQLQKKDHCWYPGPFTGGDVDAPEQEPPVTVTAD